MQFVFAELAIAVFVELLQRGRRVGNLFGRQHTVVIRVEHFHQRIARRPMSPAAAFGRTLAVVLVITAWRTFRGLRDNNGSAQGAQNSHDPKRATHLTGLPKVFASGSGLRLSLPRRDATKRQVRSQIRLVVTERRQPVLRRRRLNTCQQGNGGQPCGT
jgi:hypothetical protein